MVLHEIEIGRDEDDLIMSLSPTRIQIVLKKGDYFIPTYALIHGSVEDRIALGDPYTVPRYYTNWREEGKTSFSKHVVDMFVSQGSDWKHKPIFSIYRVGSNLLTHYYTREDQVSLEFEVYRSNSNGVIKIPMAYYFGDVDNDFDLFTEHSDNYFELRDFVSSNVRAMQKRVVNFQIA